MTIKEMEERCGMSRTNIRFYESEGLIRPDRRENGYRDYSPEDARTLMKVKLLRSMDVPLDQVKAAAFGERRLSEVLEDLDQDIDRRQTHQERTRQILQNMKEQNTEFENLKPEAYLDQLESETTVEDAPPKWNLPWRRYFARCFDVGVYSSLLSILLWDYQMPELFRYILPMLAMLVLEPLLLHLFATTPGKAIFGIRVTDREGNRLDYNTAIERTWTVMWEGEALRIPLVCQYFQYKSLSLAENGEPLSWEGESELTYRDDKLWRCFLYVAAEIAMCVLTGTILMHLGG